MRLKTMRIILMMLVSIFSLQSAYGQTPSYVPKDYKGTPFLGKPQIIPGRMEFEFHDDGGLGVGFRTDYIGAGPIKDYRPMPHISVDETNSGANVDTYFDGTLYPSAANPHSWYGGWTHVNDMSRFTVNVTKTDDYYISSTFSQGEEVHVGFSLTFNGDASTKQKILLDYGTGGGFHTWKKFDRFTKVHLKAGLNLIEFWADIHHVNYDYLEFIPAHPDDQTLTSIVVTPKTTDVSLGKSIAFNAQGIDQVGQPMAITPTWTVSSGGTIDPAGLFTGSLVGGPYNVTASVGDISGSAQVNVTSGPTGDLIPGVVQAENYAQMFGIKTEVTKDVGGGKNVGWIEKGDWMTFLVTASKTGTYSANFRVAGWQNAGRIELQNSENVKLTGANVPNTGDYQKWATVPGEDTFTLHSGTQTIRVYSAAGSWNINWLEFKYIDPPVLTNIALTPVSPVVMQGNPLCFTYVGYDQFGKAMTGLPAPTWSTACGTIDAKGCFSSNTIGNCLIRIAIGEITSTAAITIVAAPVLTSISVLPSPAMVNIGMSQQFTAVGKDQYGAAIAIVPDPVWTATGSGTISDTGLYTAGNTPWSALVTAQSIGISGSATVNVTNSGIIIPGRFEAENYTAMQGIKKEPCTDTGGGEDVGYIESGDWLDYNVYVTKSGTYDVSIRVASQVVTGSFQFKIGNDVLASAAVPNTGSWKKWTTITTTLALTQGAQTIRVLATGSGLNINWFDFALSDVDPDMIKVEAENYTAMQGIQTQPTTDTGGGLNIGWTEPGDYLDYAVTIPTAGTYNINFRIASGVDTGKIELRNQAGKALATLAQANTGGWQVWVTRMVPAILPAGPQTLRIHYVGAGLNINWFTMSSLEPGLEVTGLQAVSSDSSVILNWTPPVNNNTFTKVQISFAPSGANPIEIPKGTNTAKINNLLNGTTYTFTVKVADASNNLSTGVQATATPGAIVYLGVPFHDSVYNGGPQVIPGRLQNEYFDMMDITIDQKKAGAEEGICYHEVPMDNINSGSGTFNGTGTYNKEFRMDESADISYTKFNNPGVLIDDNPYDFDKPDPDSLYLGWIAPGEWVNYTVNVTQAGYYSISTMYTSKFGGHISFDSNGKDVSGPIALLSNFVAADPVDWRQAHHWRKSALLGRFYLPAGKQVLTLHFLDQPVFNFDYMDFVKVP